MCRLNGAVFSHMLKKVNLKVKTHGQLSTKFANCVFTASIAFKPFSSLLKQGLHLCFAS